MRGPRFRRVASENIFVGPTFSRMVQGSFEANCGAKPARGNEAAPQKYKKYDFGGI
jgi:hypothetical protein